MHSIQVQISSGYRAIEDIYDKTLVCGTQSQIVEDIVNASFTNIFQSKLNKIEVFNCLYGRV